MSLPPAQQSALAPHGTEAAAIHDLTLVMTAGAVVVMAVVMVLVVMALRGSRPGLARTSLVVAGGVVFPAVVLAALLVYTQVKETRAALGGKPDVTIELVGHQWWWQVRYLDGEDALDFTTANEIRIPARASVEVRLKSADVLHSFWVPALAGKLDLIPGRENRLRITAQKAGTYRGQCAEYCGGPHAQMALFVVAQEADDFKAWRAAQRQPQKAGGQVRGAALFLEHCAGCHTVRGTRAAGTRGPDLTHVASRISIGAGILPNDAASIARWVGASQHIKPGNLMPDFGMLDPASLQAVVEYMGTLR